MFQKNSDPLGPKEMGVLKTLLIFAAMMLIAPIFAYFFMKSFLFEGYLGYEDGSVNAVIGTVVFIHIIIGWYIYIAVKEEQQEHELVKTE
eukprot:gene7189-7995_t